MPNEIERHLIVQDVKFYCLNIVQGSLLRNGDAVRGHPETPVHYDCLQLGRRYKPNIFEMAIISVLATMGW